MGQLSRGLTQWVRAMNSNDDDRDAKIKDAFDEITKGWFLDHSKWDKTDQFAADILEAFCKLDS